MAKKKAAKTADITSTAAPKKIEMVRLSELHLDPGNPRFGMAIGTIRSETKIVDHIVKQYGVQDVLSSIAVNGYFGSEPLIVRREGSKLVVAEGNRRLTACLILACDPRAKNQKKRSTEFRAINKRYGGRSFDPVPAVIFESKEEIRELLPFLGVRHIAGAQEWDSYAKAAWVAQAVDSGELELEDIINMIGDNTRLARRMLQGYYVVQQLVQEGLFNPAESKRSGQRSESEFPFSWVYSVLAYKSIIDWLELPEEPQKRPLDKEHLQDAANLFEWMFGQEGREPAIVESRQLKDLAYAATDSDGRRLLRAGRSAEEILRMNRPTGHQIADGLTQAHQALSEVFAVLGEASLARVDADECIPLSNRIRRLSLNIHKSLEAAAGLLEDDDD